MLHRLAPITLAALLAALPVSAQDSTEMDPEMLADMADVQTQELESILADNPTLLDGVISDAIRRNPDVVKSIIRDTLLRNPQIVINSLQEFQRQQAQAQASSTSDNLSADFLARVTSTDNAAVRGNPQGSITLVEFSDYNCPHCRSFSKTLERLISANPDLRVIQREWPILGQDSVDVSKIALAARAQGKYDALHKALMGASERLDADAAYKIAAEVGLDLEQLKADASSPLQWDHIRTTAGLAQEVELKGTPAIVIGDELARGAASEDQLQPLIDAMKVK